jgi:hypothetical protein
MLSIVDKKNKRPVGEQVCFREIKKTLGLKDKIFEEADKRNIRPNKVINEILGKHYGFSI